MHPALANPMWASLSTTHARFALTCGALKRFMPDIAPFCAVEHEDSRVDDATCLQAGETVYWLGVHPRLPPNWTVLARSTILQMVYDGPAAPAVDDPAPALGVREHGAMAELTALVYPEFFRPRTPLLGQYIGVYRQGRLAAMAGQRLACPGYREISAVCTHPDERGQGHAGRLIRQLSHTILAAAETPFLHVSASNRGAWGLYERLGFVASRELAFIKVRID